jgi:myo-inositol 2-dehydrogenase/D-chiro-inositol 1-dehydrogenase
LAGVGRIGTFHAETLASLEGVAAITVADSDPARAAEVAARHGFRTAETAEALVESGVEALVIATPTESHAELIGVAARSGVPVFCEKPVALDLERVDAVLDEVARAGILVQIGFQRRFDAGYRAAYDAVRTGALGKLLVLRAATHDPAPPPEGYIATSGGIFRDLQIHDIDAIRYVTGEDVVEVYADGAVRETGWFGRYDDVDAAVAVLRLSGGGLAILSGTRRDPLGYDVRLEVFGTNDSIAVGVDERSPLRSVEPGVAPGGVGYRDFIDRFGPAYRGELAAFVAAVRQDGDSPCSLEDARAALAAAVAADTSRALRRPVSLAEVTGAEMVSVTESQHANADQAKERTTT